MFFAVAFVLLSPGPIPVKCCGESSVEEAVVLMRPLPVPVVDQAGARRVVVVRKLLAIRDRGGGELVTLHLLLVEKPTVKTCTFRKSMEDLREIHVVSFHRKLTSNLLCNQLTLAVNTKHLDLPVCIR